MTKGDNDEQQPKETGINKPEQTMKMKPEPSQRNRNWTDKPRTGTPPGHSGPRAGTLRLAFGLTMLGGLLSAGALRGQQVLYTFAGDSAPHFFGTSVSGANDVNSDGFADLIVGALGDDNNGDHSGSARN